MHCPACHTENPLIAKFCFACGTALAAVLRCASCQAELAAGARFCMSCGQPVAAVTPSDDARLARLAAAAPAPLAAKLRGAALSGERRVVTALFADVVGSTTLAEQMDAEDWTAIMNGAFDRISSAIYHYEGTIARLLGDALLAFFGAPLAHEDDPVRAVRAALDLLAAAQLYAAEVERRHGIPFAMRIGINTGPVVVGAVGSDLKYEYTAMGDAVNLAARLQSAAQPMTVLISEPTYRFVAPVFDCRDLGLIEVKGKAEPVQVYEVIGPKALPERVRGLAGLASAMVGRDAELATLAAQSAALGAGRGGAAVIIGEPGLGKTRLIAEWRAATLAALPGVRWAEGHCLSYGQGLAYHLLIDLVRGLLEVTAADDEPAVGAALGRLTDELFGPAADEVAPFLGHLLSLRLDAAAAARIQALDPQALQGSYLAALRQLIAALAARQPLVLILDDTHWADPSSAELLIKLLALTDAAPVLFAFVTRPDHDVPGWSIVVAARQLGRRTELALAPLSEAASRVLVSNLLEVEALPDGVRRLILSKAEGNPFFVEEVIRMLIDRGAIVREGQRWAAQPSIEALDIPDNLQGLLLARIDRLPEEVRRTLRVAAVIGRQFSVKVLAQVLASQQLR